jgi:hypothetical protein
MKTIIAQKSSGQAHVAPVAIQENCSEKPRIRRSGVFTFKTLTLTGEHNSAIASLLKNQTIILNNSIIQKNVWFKKRVSVFL